MDARRVVFEALLPAMDHAMTSEKPEQYGLEPGDDAKSPQEVRVGIKKPDPSPGPSAENKTEPIRLEDETPLA